MAGKTKPGSALKGINIKLKMINDLMDVTGSAKDSWNPAEISDDMKAIAYIHRLADTWNPAQLNEALKYLGFDTIDSWNPAIIEETKNKLVKYFLPTEATGNPITFNTYGNLPYEVSKAEVTFLPKQDLHGYDNPWVGGAGKNKLQNSGTSKTENGVTFTVNSDGSVTIKTESGGATNNTNFVINTFIGTDGTRYIMNGIPSGLSSINMTAGNLGATDTGSGASFTYDSTKTDKSVRIWCLTGFTATTPITVKPMIRLSSVTDATFAPYSNICPISGRTEVNLSVSGKNLLNPSNCVDNLYISTIAYKFATIEGGSVFYAYVSPNTTYTVSANGGDRTIIATSDSVPADNVDVKRVIFGSGTLSVPQTFTTQADETLVCIYLNRYASTKPTQVQLEVGSQATTYTPFVSRTEYTETLGSTYYGGKVDFVSGKGLEEWDYIASYDGETLPGEWISDRDVYAPGTTPTTGAEVAYKLSEAVELTLTPTEIELLKGQNVIWTDGDDILIEYKALLNS